jgi:hypothetical protein
MGIYLIARTSKPILKVFARDWTLKIEQSVLAQIFEPLKLGWTVS